VSDSRPAGVVVTRKFLDRVAAKQPPEFVAELTAAASVVDDAKLFVPREKYVELASRYKVLPKPGTGKAAAPGRGPGTELKKLLARLGINADEKGCQCKSRAAQMDRWGCDACMNRLDTIVGWLREEAARRNAWWPGNWAGRLLVKRAIRSARRAAS